MILLGALLLGLVGRFGLLTLAPRYGYVYDHFDNVQMGRAVAEHGLEVYEVPRVRQPAVKGQVWSEQSGAFESAARPAARVPNYPPLGLSLFYLGSQGVESGQVNTRTARTVMALPVLAFELLLTAGVFLLVRRLAGAGWAVLAASATWLMPPLAMDTALWGQTDAWLLGPAVWILHAMLGRRWLLAGAVWGVALLLKPQAVLLVPVALLAAGFLESPRGDLPGTLGVRLGKFLLAGLLLAGLLSLPWTLADGGAWFRESYLRNLTEAYPMTTARAFNVWYFDALSADADFVRSPLEATRPIAGMTRDAWGRVLLIGAMLILAALVVWRYRRRRELGLIVFAGLWLWSAFMLPTRVHERYVVYCIPFLLVAAVVLRRLWIVAILLAIVGGAELSHNRWLKAPAGSWPRVRDQVDRQARRYAREYGRILQSGQRPEGPTPPEARRQRLRHARREYRALRTPYRRWELLLTLLSVGAWVAGAVACFVKLPWRDQEPHGSRPRGATKPKRT